MDDDEKRTESAGAAPKEAPKPVGKAAKPTDEGAPGSRGRAKDPRLLRAAVVAIAVVVALVAWLATRDSGSDAPEPTSHEAGPPRIVTVDELREVAVDLGQPIYWTGPIEGKELELTELEDGGVQVRYVPEGTEAGEGSPKSLTVGSYPLPDPEQALEKFAERPGSTPHQAGDGREVVSSTEAPTSAYFTSADNSVQVEVYDPSPKRALELALSGKVEPAG